MAANLFGVESMAQSADMRLLGRVRKIASPILKQYPL